MSFSLKELKKKQKIPKYVSHALLSSVSVKTHRLQWWGTFVTVDELVLAHHYSLNPQLHQGSFFDLFLVLANA